MGNVFTIHIHTENNNQAGIATFGPHEMTVLTGPTLGHPRYGLTDVPPQPNSPADCVRCSIQFGVYTSVNMGQARRPLLPYNISQLTLRAVVFQLCIAPTYATAPR